MSNKSLEDRKRAFLEDCCGGGGGAPTMSGGDVGYQADAPAEGPVAGFDPMLGGRKKKKLINTVRKLRKEGFVKRSPRKHDKMNDQALKFDMEHRRELSPDASDATLLGRTKFSSEGEKITGEVQKERDNPTEYAKEKKSEMIANRAAGYRAGKYKTMKK